MVTSPAQDGNSRSATTANTNIFEDPAIAAAAKNDPFAQFVAKNWKRIAGVLFAVVLGMIAYNAVRTTQEQKRAVSTALFAQVREQYKEIVGKRQELVKLQAELSTKPDAEKKAVQDKITALETEVGAIREKSKLMLSSLDSPPPFDLLGRLYGGLIAAQFGEYEQTKSALINTPWELTGRAGSPERMTAELAVLGLGKALSDSSQHVQYAKDSLVRLAENGEFAAVPALEALAALASTSEEVSKVKSILGILETRFPSQSKYLTEVKEGL